MKNKVPFFEITSLEDRQEGKYSIVKCRGRFPELGPGFYRVFPDNKKVTVKEITRDGDFYYLAVKGIVKKALHQGKVLVPADQVVTMSKKGFFMLPQGSSVPQGPKVFFVRGGFSETYPMGYWRSVKASIRPVGGNPKKIPLHKQVYQVTFSAPIPMISGGIYTMSAKNSDESFQMVLVFPRALPDAVFKDFLWRVQRFRSFPTLKSIYSIQIRTSGFAQVSAAMAEESFDGITFLGRWGILEEQLGKYERTILKRSKQAGGVEKNTLLELLSIPEGLLDGILLKLTDENSICIKDQWVLNTSLTAENGLSPFAKGLWESLKNAGEEGVFVKEKASEAVRENFKAFYRMDIAIPLEDLYIEKKAFLTIVEKVMEPFNQGDEISISDIRDITGFSRPYVLALFHYLEDTGLVKREGDLRIVL